MTNNNLFFWHGRPFLLKEKIDSWKTSFIEKHGDFNLDIFNANDNSINEIVNSIQTPPMFGDKRLIFIKNLPPGAGDKKLGDKEVGNLLSVFDSIPETTVVVFVSANPDKRTKTYKTLVSKATIEDHDISEKRIPEWVNGYVANNKVSIEKTALTRLISLTGASHLHKIINEIKKLQSYRQEEQITIDDVNLLIKDTSEVNIFKITNLISSGKTTEAMLELQNILRGNEDMVHVLNLIIRQIRLLIATYELRDRDSGHIGKTLKVAPFVASTLKGQIKNFKIDQLLKMHKALYEIDKKLKTSQIKGDKILALEVEKNIVLA